MRVHRLGVQQDGADSEQAAVAKAAMQNSANGAAVVSSMGGGDATKFFVTSGGNTALDRWMFAWSMCRLTEGGAGWTVAPVWAPVLAAGPELDERADGFSGNTNGADLADDCRTWWERSTASPGEEYNGDFGNWQ